MSAAEELARFAVNRSYEDLSRDAVEQLKIRILDSIGCATGALTADPVHKVKEHVQEFAAGGPCSLVGGGAVRPDLASFYNGFLIRYLDFNDSYLAKGETCHPSDNFSAVLAAAEYANKSGKDLMTALAVAYQVQCRLSDTAPVRAKGFDHTTQGSFSVAAAASKVLGLDVEQTTHALAICGTAFNALRVTRTGSLSHWKGLAFPNTAFCCIHGVLLARRGITGPREVFEGNKGFMESISGPFRIDWSKENLERVNRSIVKKYNAEVHSQAAIEGLLELKEEHGFSAAEVARIDVRIFDVAYHIIGGGEEGDKTTVQFKEEADHSLPYLLAVALLDGRVMPEQYQPDRIQRDDVQQLLKRVKVSPDVSYSERFPAEVPCRIQVFLTNGQAFSKEKFDYEGFHTSPIGWQAIQEKFKRLSRRHAEASVQNEIIHAVDNLDIIKVQELTRILQRVQGESKEQYHAEQD